MFNLPSLLAIVLAASQAFASPISQDASSDGMLEKRQQYGYGGGAPPAPVSHCTHKLLRRPWHKLSKAEKTAYLDAEVCLMKLPSKLHYESAHTRFDDMIKAHQVQASIYHLDGLFLPFHRLHMHAHEKLLREECGYKGAQPYWDEAIEAGKFSKSKIFDPVYGFGGDGTGKGADGSGSGGCIETGRFASYTLHTGPSFNNVEHCITRNISDVDSASGVKENVKACLDLPDFASAWPCLETKPHFAGHSGVGGEMANSISSPNDPLFYMHHTYLDLLWWRWQKRHLTARLHDISGYTTQDEPATGWVEATLDTELNMLGIIPNATVRDIIDNRGDLLCVEYEGV
ncbi:Di-copper centre-containing protein [Wilcoxina mikolae CBS 423.85]|nr:Di-copper centre-containing protein [Wilcoxina mikolae CBS 423.85]